MFGELAVGVLVFSYAFVDIFQKWSNGIYSKKKSSLMASGPHY